MLRPIKKKQAINEDILRKQKHKRYSRQWYSAHNVNVGYRTEADAKTSRGHQLLGRPTMA